MLNCPNFLQPKTPTFLPYALTPLPPHMHHLCTGVVYTAMGLTKDFGIPHFHCFHCSVSSKAIICVMQNSGKQNSRQTTRQRVEYFATSAEFRYGCCCYLLALDMQPLLSHDLILWAGREQGAPPSQTFLFPLVITPLNSFCLNRAKTR